MTAAALTQKGRGSRASLALHVMGRWALQGTLSTLSRVDQWGSDLHWSELSGRRCVERLAGVMGVAPGALHCEAPDLTRRCGHVVVDLCAVRLVAGITSAVLWRLEVGAFHRSLSVADTLRDVLMREFSHTNGGSP